MKNKSRSLVALLLGMTVFGLWVGYGQQREVPGDRMRLDAFYYDRATNTLHWTATEGSLVQNDAGGEYREAGPPVTCTLEFSEYRATCHEGTGNGVGQVIELGAAEYGNLAAEMNDLLVHVYAIAQIVRAEQGKGRASR